MNIVAIISFSLSIIFLGLSILLDFTKKGYLSTHTRAIHYALVFLTSIFSFIYSASGLPIRVIVFGILTSFTLLLYEGFNIFNLYSTKLTKYKDKIEVYSALALYILIFIALTIYYGFNFIELIALAVLSVIFYSSCYIIKREETPNSLRLFFIYSILVSLVAGLSFTGMILSSKGSDIMMVFLFMFIGLILIYSSSLIRHGNMIFDYLPNKNYLIYDKVTYFIYNLGIAFISFSVLFMFY